MENIHFPTASKWQWQHTHVVQLEPSQVDLFEVDRLEPFAY